MPSFINKLLSQKSHFHTKLTSLLTRTHKAGDFSSFAVKTTSATACDPLSPSGIIGPSMITRSEAEFFSECARGPLPPEGAIVDLGCFMGSTAIALARGLIEAGRGEQVLAYDLFTWAEWMNGSPTYGLYMPGDDFLPEARRYARDHGGGLIQMHKEDLSEYLWNGRPIALLLVDAMKNFDLARQIARTFYPALLPGTVVIHQDFKHYYTPWIHVLQYRLREHFEVIRSIADGGTVAFRLTIPISEKEAYAISDLEAIPDDEVERVFQYSMGLLPPGETANVAAAHVMLYHHLARDERALEPLARYRALGLDQMGEFPGMLLQYYPRAQRAA
jgi:Methyltransferase domain